MRVITRLGLAYLALAHVPFIAAIASDRAALHVRESLIAVGVLRPPSPGDDPALVSLAREKAIAAPSGSVLLVGDSQAAGLPENGLPGAVNLGIAGARSDQLANNLPPVRSASAVVVMIGTNDVLQGRADQVGRNFRLILNRIPGPVVVVAPPIEPAIAAVQANLCGERPRCTFVDTARVIGPGQMRPDGIHLTAQGYRALLPAIVEALHQNSALSASPNTRPASSPPANVK